MFSKIISILTGVVLVVGLAEAGTGYKAPKRLTGSEPMPVFDGPNPPVVSALGPGDSLGYTFYDYGSNGGPNRNLINYGDGQFSFARMASVDSASDTRGSYYKFNDGASWTTGCARLAAARFMPLRSMDCGSGPAMTSLVTSCRAPAAPRPRYTASVCPS